MPLVQTRGAASAQGFGEFAQATVANYIEEVFSCFLYTGNGSTQTITNGIDLSTKGGMVWLKDRSSGQNHALSDTVRGVGSSKQLQSNTTSAATTDTLTGFTTSGFTLDASFGLGAQNLNTVTYASWTFREQPKFFDIVTWSGSGINTTIPHSLGAVPGSIIVKRTDTAADWAVYHRSLANTQYLVLNTTAAAATGATWWNSTTPTSAVFSVGTDASVNASGGTYVAYVFAHDAGGFGLTGTDNVISCGTLTGSGAGVSTTVTLGYEPQFIIAKVTGAAQNWIMFDNMRGFDNTNAARLFPNLANAESTVPAGNYFTPTATGFVYGPGNSMGDTANIIYIAIRRGPMKVPTLGTSVFGLSARSGTGANATVTGGQTDDAVIIKNRGSAVGDLFASRLTGTGYLETSSTAAEVAAGATILQTNPWDVMDGVKVGTTSTITNASANTYINYLFRRAPGFFDEVCFTQTTTSGAQAIAHNLTVAPELVIVKPRSQASSSWEVFPVALNNRLNLNATTAASTYAPLSSVTTTSFSYPMADLGWSIGVTYVAYLFATCAGVSKVGSYTGNGTTQTIDCGFTGGARFVLIKRTDSTGDWYTYDTIRGMTVLTDPYLLLNSAVIETATLGSVTTVSTGFAVDNAILAGINAASPAAYIFLAIA